MNEEAKVKYLKKLNLNNYSSNTIKSYTHCFQLFLDHFHNTNIDVLTNEQITDYLYEENKKGYGQNNQSIRQPGSTGEKNAIWLISVLISLNLKINTTFVYPFQLGTI